MRRRALLRALGLTAAVALLGGHTPYGQWVVYRKKHLLIGCHKGDPRTYELAKRTVAALDETLPDARARVARAPHAGRLASLLGTEQLETAILSEDDALQMSAGAGTFAAYGAVALRLLAPVEDRLLIARRDFRAQHAWLVTEALVGTELVAEADLRPEPRPGWHLGSLAFLRARPEHEKR